MRGSFRAYIDESGDEGFSFRRAEDGTGCSEWFVLAAPATRTCQDLETVKIIDKVRAELDLSPRKHVHWRRLKHAQKVRYAQMLALPPVRVIGVCIHKPSILEPRKFRERYRLYFYAVRHLLERVSWLARETCHAAQWGGDGSTDMLFSNRQGMSYSEMKAYLEHLRVQKERGRDVRIDFEHVPINRITTQTPGRSMCPQLADAAAGAFFNGLERERYGNTEPRCIQTMSPLLCRHRGMTWGYGITLLPREAAKEPLGRPHLVWLDREKKQVGPGS